jgi:hypothetical protein
VGAVGGVVLRSRLAPALSELLGGTVQAASGTSKRKPNAVFLPNRQHLVCHYLCAALGCPAHPKKPPPDATNNHHLLARAPSWGSLRRVEQGNRNGLWTMVGTSHEKVKINK